MSFKCNIEGLVVGDSNVNNHSEAKFLGLVIDSELKFKPYIIVLGKKSHQTVMQLRSLLTSCC